MQHVSELLKEQGVTADRIKQESFGGRPPLRFHPHPGTRRRLCRVFPFRIQFRNNWGSDSVGICRDTGHFHSLCLPSESMRHVRHSPLTRQCDHGDRRRPEREQDAQDVVQESYLELFGSLPVFALAMRVPGSRKLSSPLAAPDCVPTVARSHGV